MADRRLAVAVYRGLLRWGRSSRGIPFQIRASDLYTQDSAVHLNLKALDAPDPVSELARLAFRKNRFLQVGPGRIGCRPGGVRGARAQAVRQEWNAEVKRVLRGVGHPPAGGCQRPISCGEASTHCCGWWPAGWQPRPLHATTLAVLALSQDGAAQDALESGLVALRLLNSDYAETLAAMKARRADRADRWVGGPWACLV